MAYKFQLGTAHLSGAIVLDQTSDQFHLSGGLDLAADSIAVDSLNITNAAELANAAAVADADEMVIHDNNAGVAKKVGIDTLKDLFSSAVNIDGYSALGGAGLHQTQDHFLFSDNGTEKKITFSNLQDAVFADVSGDATIAAGGALTLANDAVEQAMIADDAVGADQLASSAVVNASVVDGALKADKLDLDGSTDIGADLADADLIIVDDAAGGTNRVAALSRIKKYIFSALSGDGTASDSGALTLAANSVSQAQLDDDAVGADELAANAVVNASIASNAAIDMDKLDGGSLASTLSDLAQGDLMYAGDVDDSNNLKSITFSNLEDAIFGNVSGDATIAAGGALTIANDAVEQAMIADDAVGADQLASSAVVNASVVDGALKADKLDIDGSTDIGAALADADLIIVDDGAAGSNRKAALSRVKTYIADVTLTTAAQTNITSLGTLTALSVDASIAAQGLVFDTANITGSHEVVAGGLRTTASFIAGYSSSFHGPANTGPSLRLISTVALAGEPIVGGLVAAGRTSLVTGSLAAVSRPSYVSVAPSGSEDIKLFLEPPSAAVAGMTTTIKFNGGQAGNVLVLTSSAINASGIATGGDTNVLFDSLHALTMSSPMAAVNLLWNGSSYEIF